MRKIQFLLLVLFLSIFMKYCATGEEYLKPGADFSRYSRLAVLPLTDYFNSPGSGQQVADIISFELLKRGFSVIDRANTQKILSEQKLSLSGVLDETSILAVGRILGVQALLTGSINEYSTTYSYISFAKDPTYMPISATGLTLKLIDTETGEIVWASTGRATQIGEGLYSVCSQNAVKKMLLQLSNHLK